MNLEMLDFNNILSFLEYVCLVVNQLVNHPYSKVLSVSIVFLEEMVYAQEDHLNWDLITLLMDQKLGLDLTKFQTKSSLTLMK